MTRILPSAALAHVATASLAGPQYLDDTGFAAFMSPAPVANQGRRVLQVSRRRVLLGLGMGLLAGGFAGRLRADPSPATLSPPELLEAVRSGDVLLVDIRRPDEWRATGLAEGAVPIDMRRRDFIDALRDARASDSQPVALICAAGVRSRWLTARLTQAGMTPVIDVPEGMSGSAAGPGWLRRALPVQVWTD